MTTGWLQRFRMPNYVTEERFEAAMLDIRQQLDEFRDDVSSKLDAILVLFTKLDQERIVTNARLDRLESKVFGK